MTSGGTLALDLPAEVDEDGQVIMGPLSYTPRSNASSPTYKFGDGLESMGDVVSAAAALNAARDAAAAAAGVPTRRAADLIGARTPQEADEAATLASFQTACKAKSEAQRELALREIGQLGFARRRASGALAFWKVSALRYDVRIRRRGATMDSAGGGHFTVRDSQRLQTYTAEQAAGRRQCITPRLHM